MSQENVEFVRRMLDQAEDDPEAMYECLADDVEWEASELELPGRATYHGPEGVREFFRDWVGAFEAWGYEAEEFIDAADATVVQIHQWGRGKGSGVAVDNRFWQVWTVRNGKVIRATHHFQKARALKAAGLSE
jgi:ketosteroid isomerase-like protein